MEIGIYVHIPFCIKKCYYCDFVSYANSFEMQDDYIKKLKQEIEENKEYLKNNEITTIYIGGGTPSSIKEEHIKEILEKIVNLKPKHISVYSLIVEEATPIEKMINLGKLKLPEEEEERNEYHYTKNYLELNGYKHYEISNFAIDGYESKHNTNCWKQKSYIGFGIAAHSYMNGVRYSNTTDLKQYLIKSSKEIKTIHEKQNKEEMKKEYMMLGLRMLDGVKISEFKAKFGENPIFLFRKELEKLVNEELVEIDLDNIKLTNKGLDLANLVWEEFV